MGGRPCTQANGGAGGGAGLLAGVGLEGDDIAGRGHARLSVLTLRQLTLVVFDVKRAQAGDLDRLVVFQLSADRFCESMDDVFCRRGGHIGSAVVENSVDRCRLARAKEGGHSMGGHSMQRVGTARNE